MKKAILAMAVLFAATTIAPQVHAASEEPFWQQAPLAGGEPGRIGVLRFDDRSQLVGRAAAKGGTADQGVAGLVIEWTRNVWVSATGAFNEEGTAVSGHVNLHLDF